MGVGGQCHTPTALPPGKTRYPLYRRLGGPQGWFRQVRKPSPPPGFDPWTVQPLANHYTDYTIPAHKVNKIKTTFNFIYPSNMKTLCNKNYKIPRMPLKWLPHSILAGSRGVFYAVVQITSCHPHALPHDLINVAHSCEVIPRSL
jgi:hypothetical protein